jgi:hypothetical protein
MAAEKETVEPVAQEQTIHVHDASGDEHIQPKPIAISTPAMVLEAMAKRVPDRLEGEQATIPIVEKPLPTSSVELVAQDEAIAATSTAKSPTSEEEVAAPTAEDVGDAAENNDAQVGGNEASGMDVDLHTESPPENAANNVPDDRQPPAIAPTEGRDREQPSVEAALEEVQVEASAKASDRKTSSCLRYYIALVAQSVTVEHTGAQGREEFISPEAVQTEVDELPTLKSKESPIV